MKRNSLSFQEKKAERLILPENRRLKLSSLTSKSFLFFLIFAAGLISSYAQTTFQPNYSTGYPQNNNYMANSTAFRQEIARLELNVVREGKEPLPLTQVPRLEKNDVLQVRLLEEQVNGMKPDQSNWDWTFLVAFINPARNNEKENIVSQEIQFRKTGWYKQYSFVVPYDSQPVVFLYTKPNYRNKILNLVSKNQEEIRKIGEKTIEISDAYAKIGSFLSELQYVINRYQYSGIYGGYGTYNPYGAYNPYGTTTSTGFNQNLFMDQAVERLARSFNIQLPNCWQNGYSYGGYNPYGTNNYGTYNPYGTNNQYGGYNYGYNNYGMTNDFVGRAQCVAKSVRIEDLDISVSRLLQQGGILGAAQLAQKYPQIAFWINVAAAALDFILKVTKKTPLRIVPTVISASENQAQGVYQQSYSANQINPYQGNNYINPNAPNPVITTPRTAKISLYAEAPPNETNFVTAYPLVVQKWQANPDPEVLNLPIPSLAEPCLHAGQNILRSTDILIDWMADNFTKDFKLVISSPNGFRKEFPLKKNVGLNGWELNVTKEDINAFPKMSMTLDSIITGKRGFNDIQSPKFNLPVPNNSAWEIEAESQKAFTSGGKRRVTLRNQMGSCRCLQTVVYKPSIGGQFVYEVAATNGQNSLQYSLDGKEVSFEVDATSFQPGQGQLELRQYGGEISNLSLNLYPAPPNITDLKISKGDNKIVIAGERLEQLRAVKINGKRAIPVDRDAEMSTAANNQNADTRIATNNQNNYPVPSTTNANTSITAQNNYQNGNQIINSEINRYTPLNGNQGNANSQVNSQSINSNSNPTSYPNSTSNNYPNSSSNSNPNNYLSNYSKSNPNSNPNNYSNVYGANTGNIYGSNSGNIYDSNTATVSPNNPTSPALYQNQSYQSELSSKNERTFIFEDPNVRQEANTIFLEMEVEGNRLYTYQKAFLVSLARPTIVANENKEVEGVATRYKTKLPPALSSLPIFPIDTSEISVNLQNALTDYDFKVENLQIETRIEGSQGGTSNDLPKANFEVLDWKNMQVTFQLNENFQKLLGGRRLQFRIHDRVRGDSDWYSLRQTFVRVPTTLSVKCSKIARGDCQMYGTGVEYVSQVSVDDSKTWFPQERETLKIIMTSEGRKAALIPHHLNQKLLRIRLRDFYTTEGIAVVNFFDTSNR